MKPRTIVVLLLGSATLAVVAGWLALSGREALPELPRPERPSASPRRLPGGRVSVRLSQRSAAAIPGFDGRYRIAIADITRGQTIVQALGPDGKTIAGPRSLREGQEMDVVIDGATYVLRVTTLLNRLIGDDEAVVALREE